MKHERPASTARSIGTPAHRLPSSPGGADFSVPMTCLVSLLALVAACAGPGPEEALAVGAGRPSAVERGSGVTSVRVAPSLPDAPWDAPALRRAVAVQDGRTGEPVAWDAMLDDLAGADVVFVGETHDDETTHRVELGVLEGLLARRDGRVVLALEMFERDVQPALDAYLAGETDEATFLAASRPWGNYRTAYRPLVETARRAGAPVVASNFPRPLTRKVATDGFDAVAAGGDTPVELRPNTAAYWRRVDNAVRGHLMMMGPRDAASRLTSTQSLWDNAMGEACADALAAHPGSAVLHVNGGFHSAYRDGTVHQLRLRAPDAVVKTVDVVPTGNPAVADVSGKPRADYVVFAEARATDLRDGAYSVWVSRELRYRLHVPDGASGDAPVPLLVWLTDEGLDPADDLARWTALVGDEAAVAVLDHAYPAEAADLGPGGRWSWPETFLEDLGVVRSAVERTWARLCRVAPVDPSRVCVAGEGTGATQAAVVALLADRIEADVVALGPRRYARVKDIPLPLPELRGDEPAPKVTLTVLGGEADRDWWADELEAYREVGLGSAFALAGDDPWDAALARENAVRGALGLDARADGERRHVLVADASPRARHWARLVAARASAADGGVVAVLEEAPADGASAEVAVASAPSGDAVPRCPGPFGGTTVVVATADDLGAWQAVAADDPLAAASRFHRMRVATADTLLDVVTTLRDEGRTNLLVVPGRFCADAATMRDLAARLEPVADALTLQWSPGLGAD